MRQRNESIEYELDPTPNIKSQVFSGISDSRVAIGQTTERKRMISVAEFCRLYGIGKSLAYAEMASGHLRFCKIGRSRRVRVDDAEAWSISTRQPLPSAANPPARGIAE